MVVLLGEKPIGKVDHFFGKIGVAVVKLSGDLKVGDKLRFKRHDSEFEQVVDSMQVDHAQVQKAKKGQDIGLKVAQPVHEGAEVFKVTE
ncbi:MAG: hypothetical protein NTW59_02570 [Candidatus Diapherotrites archaeon]|nr:hypothetical protein [Candidatus Diapherotrites archaeon]